MKIDSKGTIRRLNTCIIVFLIFSVSFSVLFVDTISSVDRPVDDITVSFTYDPINPVFGEVVQFYGMTGSPHLINIWQWYFSDDNSYSYGRISAHIFNDPGTFDVVLTATSHSGEVYTDSSTITIMSPLVVNFTYNPTDPEVDEEITFTDNSTPKEEIEGWRWDFGDGSDSHDQNPTHQYSNSRDYTVRLRVILDDEVATDIYETIITVGGNDEETEDDDSFDDSDGDGIADTDDICAGYDDNIDSDADGIPDGCDDTPYGEEPDDDDDDSKNDTGYDPDTALVTSDFDNVSRQVETEINLDKSDNTSVHRINFTLNNTYRNVTLSVENLKKTSVKIDKPKSEEISDLKIENVTVYKYLNLSLTANNTYLDEVNMTIWFRVDRIWINNNINIGNNISTTLIKLMRYHDGKWERLVTTELVDNEDIKYLYYKAVTPGLSTFAVVGGHVTKIEPEPEEEALSISWELLIVSITLTMLILVIILFKKRYIYLKK